LGGARAVAARLYRAVAEQDGGASANPHAQAHPGAVDAALAATEAMLSSAAEFVDTEPSSGRTELIARRVRAVAGTAVDEAITRTGRALGPAPLALDADHARRVADLNMYVRQSHAEQDLAALGRGMPVTGTGNAARFAARPLSGGGTSPLAWTAWGRPFPELDLTGCKSLLVVAPHPDDETLGFGSAAATLQSRGVKVQVVSVTDGDASYPGLPMRGRRKLARIHRTELRGATSVLGLPPAISLGLPDDEVRTHLCELAELLTTLLSKAPGTWCATTWRGDGHPDHEAVGEAAAIMGVDGKSDWLIARWQCQGRDAVAPYSTT
jgi:hypothetical protein